MKAQIYIVSIVLHFLFLSCSESDTDWQQATQKNTIEAYLAFIKEYPENSHFSEALEKIRIIQKEAGADKLNIISAYQAYIQKAPTSKFASEAKGAIDELLTIADHLVKTTPRERFVFGDDYKVNTIIEIEANQRREFEGRIKSQENAVWLNKENAESSYFKIVRIQGLKNFPFLVEQLSVDNQGMLFEEKLIRVKDSFNGSKGFYLIPDESTPVPTVLSLDSPPHKDVHWERAINIIWEFSKPGIQLKTKGSTYVSEAVGSRIMFTRYGVVLSGVKVQ